MSDKEGCAFEGIISGIVSWGVFVTLPNTVEGLVPVENLHAEGYTYNETESCFSRPNKRKKTGSILSVLRPGVPVSVMLERVNVEERKLFFVLTTPAISNIRG